MNIRNSFGPRTLPCGTPWLYISHQKCIHLQMYIETYWRGKIQEVDMIQH